LCRNCDKVAVLYAGSYVYEKLAMPHDFRRNIIFFYTFLFPFSTFYFIFFILFFFFTDFFRRFFKSFLCGFEFCEDFERKLTAYYRAIVSFLSFLNRFLRI